VLHLLSIKVTPYTITSVVWLKFPPFRALKSALESHLTAAVAVFTTRSSYSSAVLGVVILSICLSVTHVLCDETKQGSEDILTPLES